MKIKSILNLFKRNKGEETKTITYPGKESVIYYPQVPRYSREKEDVIIFEKDILAVLKKDDKKVLLFDERLHVFSSQYNRKLILKDIHLDEKTGEIVMVGGDYKEPVMEKGAFKTGFERPLRDCPEDMMKSNEKECLSRLLCKGREAVADKYILEPMRKLCLHGLQIDGSLNFSTYGFDGVCFKDKQIDGVYVYFLDGELKAVTVKDKNGEELKLDELTLEQIQSVGFQLFKLLEAFQEARKQYLDELHLLKAKSRAKNVINKYDAQIMQLLRDKGFHPAFIDLIEKEMAVVSKKRTATLGKPMTEAEQALAKQKAVERSEYIRTNIRFKKE